MIYNGQTLSLEEILENDNSLTVFYFNIQSLDIELFKVSNNIAPSIINDLFARSHHS